MAISSGTLLEGATGALTTAATTKFADGDVFTVNGKTVTIKAASTPAASSLTNGAGVTGNVVTDGAGNSTVYLNAGTTVGDVLKAFDLASGVQVAANSAGTATVTTATGQTVSSISGGGAISLHSTTGQDLTITGKADDLAALGLTTATGSGNATVQAFRTTGSGTLGSLIQTGSTLNVDGHVITFADAVKPATANVATGSGKSGNIVTDGNGNSTVYLQGGTTADVLNAIDLATGVKTASNSGGTATLTTTAGQTASSISTAGALKINTGVNADLAISGTGNALAALGLAGNTGTGTAFTAARTAGVGGISGKTLTFSSFNGGTAVSVTFGTGTGQVKTLNDLNTALQADNLGATLDANGLLTISAANDYASSTLGSAAAGGVIGGTLPNSLSFSTASAPVADVNAQATRASLVTQYNNILQQIDTTSQELLVQRRQPVERRPAQAGVRRDRQVDPQHHRRHLQLGGPRPVEPDDGHGLHRQLLHEQRADQPDRGQQHAALGSFEPRFEPLDRGNPPGFLQEPDQRAADRLVEPDAGRYQLIGGGQPGAVHPPVDRGVRAGARQLLAAERAPAAALSPIARQTIEAAGETPPLST